MSSSIFEQRRARVREALGPQGVLVAMSAPEFIRNNDVHHEYRQASDFFYLTGFDEPDSTLVLRGGDSGALTLFVPPRDREREVWDGPRAGVEGALERFGATRAFANTETTKKLPELLVGCDTVHFLLGEYDSHDEALLRAFKAARRLVRRKGISPHQIVDASVVVHELRRLKQEPELALMRKAIAITHEAHRAAMQLCRPGRHEYELEAVLRQKFREGGAERPAYAPIVGAGANATVLHYVRNRDRIAEGDLVLIDAGAEYEYYAADITRTFPANGRFSAPQRRVYELVLKAQLEVMALVGPGASFRQLQERTIQILTQGLVELGIVQGPVETAIEEERYKPYYMHGVGHYLGMDVHDVGRYADGDEPRPFEAGVVITVEPGLYLPKDDDRVPAEYRGIGVRIEDDVLVTATGYENLSQQIPKTVAEIEQLMAR